MNMFVEHCKNILISCDLREDLLEFIIVKKSRYYFIVAMWICINNFLDKMLKIASITINNHGDMKACKLLTLFRIPRKSYIQQVAGLKVHPMNQYAIKTMDAH
jgi:hypothetical protein